MRPRPPRNKRLPTPSVSQASRCGHNFDPGECPYEPCWPHDVAEWNDDLRAKVAALEAENAKLREHVEAMARALDDVREECELNLTCNHPGDGTECEDIDDCVRCTLGEVTKQPLAAYRRDFPEVKP